MCIYFIVELIMFLFVLLNFREKKAIDNNLLFVSCLLWAFLAGFRSYVVGNDTLNYTAFFENTNYAGVGYGTVQFPGDSIEWGFVVLSRFLHMISENGTFFLLVNGLLVYLSIFLIYKDRKYGLWGLLIFMAIGNNFVALNTAIRQSFSIAILLIGIYFIQKLPRKDNSISWYRYFKQPYGLIGILCCVFAGTIHRTSIVLFPLLALVWVVPMTKKIAYTCVCFAFIASVFFSSYIGAFFDTMLTLMGGMSNENVALLGDRYSDTFGETSSSLIRSLAWTIPCLVCIECVNKEKIKSFYMKCYIFSVCAYLLFSASYMVTRLNLLFLILGFKVVIPEKVEKNDKLKMFYILVTLYFLWRAYAGFEKWPIWQDSSLPYYFIWE